MVFIHDFKNIKEFEIPPWLFEVCASQFGLTGITYFVLTTKVIAELHMYLILPHQVSSNEKSCKMPTRVFVVFFDTIYLS